MNKIIVFFLASFMSFGQSKKEQIVILNGKIDSLKSEIFNHSLKISELNNKNEDLSIYISKLSQEKQDLKSENDSLKRNAKILLEEINNLKKVANKCQKSVYFEEITNSRDLFDLKDCFYPSNTKTNFLKHFLLVKMAEDIVARNENIDLSKEEVLDFIKLHYKNNEGYFFSDAIEDSELEKKIKDADYEASNIYLNDNLNLEVSIGKLNNNLYQINTTFGTVSSNSFTLIQKNDNGKFNIYKPYLNEIEKRLLLKTKMNLSSVYEIHGTERIKLFGKYYLTFSFAKDSNPMCCASYTIAIRDTFESLGDLSFDEVYFDSYGSNKWRKLE